MCETQRKKHELVPSNSPLQCYLHVASIIEPILGFHKPEGTDTRTLKGIKN